MTYVCNNVRGLEVLEVQNTYRYRYNPHGEALWERVTGWRQSSSLAGQGAGSGTGLRVRPAGGPGAGGGLF